MSVRRFHLVTSNPLDHRRRLVPSSKPTSAEAASSAESSALQRLRLERDAALEDLAFLREQLRSTQAFHAYRFELAQARLQAEHRSLLDELGRLAVERKRPSRREGADREKERTGNAEPAHRPLLPRIR